MKLYKNVDIADLKNILSEGILPISKTGNDNWSSKKRANNSKDVVYLFSPTSEINSFPNYGVALLEVEVDEALQNEFNATDVHKNDYKEFIINEVNCSKIKKIYIPKIFKQFINEELIKDINISWCEMTADFYNDYTFEKAPAEMVEQFAKTAPIEKATENFFRGVTSNKKRMIDLYNIKYINKD